MSAVVQAAVGGDGDKPAGPAAALRVAAAADQTDRPPLPSKPPLKRHQRVVESTSVPPGFDRRRLPAALLQLLPQRFASETAAKKACRRGEVLVDGGKAGTDTEVAGGALIEVYSYSMLWAVSMRDRCIVYTRERVEQSTLKISFRSKRPTSPPCCTL
jgi:hypothetical protein